MLLDIFGGTYAENKWFEVNRDAVAAYRDRVLRTMSGVPELIQSLLS